jgi:hypothetical protein
VTGGIIRWDRIIEEDGEAVFLQCADGGLEMANGVAERGVIFAENAEYFLRLRGLGEGDETEQLAPSPPDLTARCG